LTRARGDFWMRVVRGEATDAVGRLAATSLWLLSVGYGAALRAHLAGYRLGIARRTRLPVPVVSVGNLTLGGTGKTTAAMAIARWLRDRGKKVAYLSRGYRGGAEKQSLVVSAGSGPTVGVEEAGDEPYLVAKALPGVCVLVGKDRRRTGAAAVSELGAEAVVLDDGFQYQRLERDVDLVLVDALHPFGYDSLVPRGLLREPVRSLCRANAVWLTHCDLAPSHELEATRARVRSLAPSARLFETIHAPVRLRRLDRDDVVELAALRGRKICALSSIGNPAAFERSLEDLRAELVARVRFPDHHRYREEDLGRTVRERAAAAEWIVTTEKDAVRLPREAAERPIWVLEIALSGHRGGASLSEELDCLLRDTTEA